MHLQPELTDGSSATAYFQMSVQLQSQTSSCQIIMEWQFECHLPMHLPAAQGFGQCLLPLSEIKALMTAEIQTFLQANPVTRTLSRAARWDKLKVDIQDVARKLLLYIPCPAYREAQSTLRVRANQARAAYVAAPGSHHALDALRHTAAEPHKEIFVQATNTQSMWHYQHPIPAQLSKPRVSPAIKWFHQQL